MISLYRKVLLNRVFGCRTIDDSNLLFTGKLQRKCNAFRSIYNINNQRDSIKCNTIPKNQRHLIIHTVEVLRSTRSISLIQTRHSSTTSEALSYNATDGVNTNSFTTRTHHCGELRASHIGQTVTLCGWLEFHRVGKFVILRDGYGRTQLLIPAELQPLVERMSYETVVRVQGMVMARPPGAQQPTLATGDVEVHVKQLEVLNHARDPLPFNIREYNKARESLRMQYRYLDLRYAEMQRNLRARSRLLMDMRDFLVNRAGFVDVETPTLFCATPGGAQEFKVATRQPGHFYSLVQSPQQFKQMLMAGGVDRYFQVARCYRDEGARADRQPEFTQLDIEMSFTTAGGVIDLVERMLVHAWPQHLPTPAVPFQRITYANAMETYGSDKPDLKIPIQLVDCTEILRSNPTLAQDTPDFDARALVFRKPLTELSKSNKSKIASQLASAHPRAKLVQHKFKGDLTEWNHSISRLLGDVVPSALAQHLQLDDDCVLFLAYGRKTDVCALLGKVRVYFANQLEESGIQVRCTTDVMDLLWVVDFPLFEEAEDGSLAPVHHPFTAPHPEDLHLLDTEPLKVRSLAYDLVLNGAEVGGGSVRIHSATEQLSQLQRLGIAAAPLQHLLDALASGCPPHAGIALGLDRLLATLLHTSSIRDVIAFPKGLEGRDPISGAPVPISEHDRQLYHIQVASPDLHVGR